ncbi:ABC transporter permease [Segeticoccus rhizosphaerae]|jgi:putative spermidine/putrescine transport system permease protein|uniref:ABC transporter permease n=1 Tax=Segeticoccus rhizosphaerae TaxID=1104777 RepID=UPI00126503FD|nr:ABC transporter permease [Segeticoccus rhizosphaerae]
MQSRLKGWPNRVLVTVLYLFLLAPILVVVGISFDSESSMAFPPQGFSLQWYEKLTQNQDFITGFKVSLITAGGVALLALLIGVPVALAIARFEFRGREALSAFFLSPLLVPAIVLGLALLLVLAPLRITGTYAGLIVAHLSITIPYVIRTASMSLLTLNRSCEEAARTLGASAWVTFRKVTLPLIAPGVLAGGVIAFLISFDEAVISLFVVGPRATTLPVEIFHYVETRTDPQIAALSVVLIAISILFVVIIERVMGLKRVLR